MAGLESNKKTDALTVRERLLATAGRYAERVAFRQKENGEYVEYSYRRFRSDVEALGTVLRADRNERIMIVGENGYAWALSYLACLCGAGLAVPVDEDFTAEELLKLAVFAEVTTVLYGDGVADRLAGLPASVKRYAFSDFDRLLAEGRTMLDAGDDGFFDLPIDPGAEAVLCFTSASTDKPKGVLLSNGNLCHSLAGTAETVEVDEGDRFLSTLPLHHIFESTCTLLGALSVGASVAFGEGLRHIIRNMREVKPTVLVAVPMILEALAKWITADLAAHGEKLSGFLVSTTDLLPAAAGLAAKRQIFGRLHKKLGGSLRLVVSGSMPVDPDILKTVRGVGIATVEGYGLCECAPVVTVNPVSAFRVGSVGLPLGGTTLDIYNVQEDGRGEIRYKGKGAMLGYFKNPELTAETLRGDWLYTGDLGYLDKDGYLYIVGRKKNAMVMATGKHVYPEEIEALLSKHKFVKEAIVVGYYNEQKGDNDLVAVLHPDYAAIRAAYGDIYTRSDVETELRGAVENINAILPSYKRLALFLIKETEFDKHRSRKIRRTGVAEAVWEEYREAIQ